LTLWYAVILTIFLTIFSFLMYSEFSRALYRDADRSLLTEASSIEESLQDFLQGIFRGIELAGETKLPDKPFSLQPQIRLRLLEILEDWEKSSHRVGRNTLMIRLIGFDGKVLISNLKGWEREIIFPYFERDSVFMEKGESIQTIHFQKKPIRIYYRLVRYKDRPLFIIQCGVSIHELKGTLHRLALIILFSIPGIVLAACLAGWFLARRSFRPVDQMIRDAKKITAAYLKSRLLRTHAGDELDRLAETLNEMMDRIESSTRAIQEFSSDVSHELKTPLAIIRGEIDLALRRSRSPEALVETLRVIEGEVNELIRLVDDLMLLVRSDAKQLRFEKKKVSLRQILDQVIHFFQERAQGKKITLSLSAPQDYQVYGDAVYLKRLFNNLIDNAIKFTQEGGAVAVNLDAKSNVAVVKVIDTGIGIELEVQNKVFSRFYRADQARSQEGAGLGLNIAKAICDGHECTLGIKSQPGKGTEVTVELPVS
jgi:signal transduction histidine kinase